MAGSQNSTVANEDPINLIDYLLVVWKRRRLIGALCSASIIAALVGSLLLPKIYESTATILTPREGGEGGLLAAAAAAGVAQGALGFMMPSLAPTRDSFMAILKSRTLAASLVERLRLTEHYKVKNLEDAARMLQGATVVSFVREGLAPVLISIKVEDRDPKMAAQIANAYPEQLDLLIAKFDTGKAGRQRRFIAEQLEKTQKDLAVAEENLKNFQEKNRAVSVGAQAQGAIEVAARLKGEIIASEVQLQVMRGFATDSNPEVIRLKGQIGELKRQLAQAQYGAGLDLPAIASDSGRPQKELYVTPAKVPEMSLELARLTRDLKVQETVHNLLTQQLEQAKIAEAEDVPVVQVLDQAIPATHKTKPKIRLNILIAAAMSLCLGILLAFGLEYVEKQRELKRSH